MKSLFRETKVDTPEAVVNCTHKIRPNYFESSSIKYCKRNFLGSPNSGKEQSFIERKTKGVKVECNVTKSKFALSKKVNNLVKEATTTKFYYADVICHPKINQSP